MNKKYKTRLDNPSKNGFKNPTGTNKPHYEPTQEEIERACAYIQSLWSEEERKLRKNMADVFITTARVMM